MAHKISTELRIQAYKEIAAALRPLQAVPLGDTAEPSLLTKAEEVFTDRIADVVKWSNKFEENLRDAKVKNHVDSLREGHFKDMRRFLRTNPGVSKETAKAIIKALFD